MAGARYQERKQEIDCYGNLKMKIHDKVLCRFFVKSEDLRIQFQDVRWREWRSTVAWALQLSE